jgi:hypothetical protein
LPVTRRFLFLGTTGTNCDAIESVGDQTQRATLIDKGLSRAALYKWDDMARSFYSLLEKGYEERANPSTQRFFQQWQKLRAIQADVDVET